MMKKLKPETVFVKQEKPIDRETVVIEVPLSQCSGFATHRLNINRLSGKQAETLKRMTRGLEDAGAVLSNGTKVTDKTKAVMWLLENIGGVA